MRNTRTSPAAAAHAEETRVPAPSVVPNVLLSVEALSLWKRNTFLERRLFSSEQYRRIGRKRRAIDRTRLTIASVCWECPWARSGGVAAIGRLLPDAVKRHVPADLRSAKGFPKILRISPFHAKVFDFEGASRDGIGRDTLDRPFRTATFTFCGRRTTVEIFEVTQGGDNWYLFKDAAGTYFQADGGHPRGTSPDGSPRKGTDPYFYSAETTAAQRDSLDSLLLRDVLFAAAAVPRVLAALGCTKNLVIHAHDWTFSTLALTVKEELARPKGILESAVVALTFHNPFDHLVRNHATGRNELTAVTRRVSPGRWRFPFRVETGIAKAMPDTILECTLGLFDAPIAIVSPGFAAEVCGSPDAPRDPLQRFHFAPHLASPLAYQGAVGIQNANFLARTEWLSYTQDVIEAAERGNPGPILEEKSRRQRKMVATLQGLAPGGTTRITGSCDEGGDDLVYFHMSGRFDPSQKGFDVFAHAIDRYFQRKPDGNVRFIITPLINGLEPEPFYDHLVRLAGKGPCRGKVLIVEGRMRQINDLLAGATWSVWPSLYEPCGAATEPLAMGTPLIARATGGLTRQVRLEPSGDCCGLLYREAVPADMDPENRERALGEWWKNIEETTDPEQRLRNPLYESLVAALAEKLVEAVQIRTDRAGEYARMLARTSQQVEDEFFSAERFGRSYWRLYDTMTA